MRWFQMIFGKRFDENLEGNENKWWEKWLKGEKEQNHIRFI